MLSVENLTVGYGQSIVLREASLQVEKGAAVGLIGANGAGKSTLINTLSGLLRPHEGSISFAGANIARRSAPDIARSGLIQVPEGRRVFAGLTVRENLEIAARGISRGKRSAAVRERLEMFPILGEKSSQAAGSLSGGQQQMLAIARALMSRPQLLMLDEPSLGLAPVIVDQVFAALAELRGRGMTILIVEQNAARALDFVSYCYVLERGRVVLSGTSADVGNDPSVIDHYLAVSRPDDDPPSYPPDLIKEPQQ